MSSTPKRQSLEELFNLPEDYLHQPVKEALRTGLIEATERLTKRDRLLKIWHKSGTAADLELRELWHYERLQVDRIMSYPGAADVMVGVVDMIETSDAFCIVYESGTMPLAAKLRVVNNQYWLRSLNAPANRLTLWRNLARLARALGTIHSQGLIHGRIDAYAVFTEGGSSPDFRLGGFEWSLVLGEVRPIPLSLQQVRSRIEQLIYSYAEDWKALGTLFTTFLNIDPERLREDDPFVVGGNVTDVLDAEVDFLRRLIEPGREDIVEASVVVRNLEGLIRELSRQGPSHAARFLLMFRPNDRMAEAIYVATEGLVAIDQLELQWEFVEGDLASGARLMTPNSRGDADHLLILTETHRYAIQPYAPRGPATWGMAIITSIVPRSEASLPSMGEVHALRQGIEIVITKEEASTRHARLRSDALDWTAAITPPATVMVDEETKTLQQGILLVQALEALLRALEILPVKTVGWRSENGRSIVQIAAREDSRDEIAAAIGERSTADFLDRLFDKDDIGIDVDWVLSTSGGLTSRARSETTARFLSVRRSEDGHAVYEFSLLDILPDEEALFLRRSGDRGTESLIKRKLRTSLVLEDQRDLVTMLVDPRRRLKPSAEKLDKEDKFFKALDSCPFRR